MLTLKVCETFTELQKAVFLWDINWSVDKAKKKNQKKQMVDFFFLTMQKHKIMKLLFYLEHFGTLNKLKTVTILMFGNVMNCECTLTG